jgi:hypothetical protein
LLCFFPDVALALQPERLPSQQWPTDCHGVTAEKNEKYILDHGISTGKRFPRNHAIMANLLRETLLDKFAATVLHHWLLVLAVRSF